MTLVTHRTAAVSGVAGAARHVMTGRRRLAWLLRCVTILILLMTFALPVAADPPAHGRRVVGYYTSWSVYGRDYHVPDIPAHLVTHVNYAFANISSSGSIMLGDYYADVDRFYPGDSWEAGALRGSFHRLQILRNQYPHLQTLISVGGWTWSRYFSEVALTESSRQAFAASCVDFIDTYGFDGVDIDWEYPVSGGLPDNIYRPEDRENYTLLLAELREQLDALGAVNNRHYLLTIAAPANPTLITNLEVESMHQYLDWINIMTYDFHGPWGGEGDPVTHFNAPLHAAGDDPLPEPARSSFNLEAAVTAYLALGVPAGKLHPGLAFYGRGYGNVENLNDGLYAPYNGPSSPGTWENGVYDYWDIAVNYEDAGGFVSHWHPEAMVPWLHSTTAGVTISYDDPLSIAAKGMFIVNEGLAGAMFWDFSADRDAVLLAALDGSLGTAPAAAVDAAIVCVPAAGTVPFGVGMTASLTNVSSDFPRRVAGRVDVHLAGGSVVGNWRSGYTNVSPLETYESSWTLVIPALGPVIGENHFLLSAQDVTPAPWNQPPYPPAGASATDTCTVIGIAP